MRSHRPRRGFATALPFLAGVVLIVGWGFLAILAIEGSQDHIEFREDYGLAPAWPALTKMALAASRDPLLWYGGGTPAIVGTVLTLLLFAERARYRRPHAFF